MQHFSIISKYMYGETQVIDRRTCKLSTYYIYPIFTLHVHLSIVCDLNESYNLKITSYFSFTETVFEQSSAISLPGIDNCLQ